MLNGQKLEAIEKRRIGNMCGIIVSNYHDSEMQMTALVNALDNWASSYGYEYHSMTETCVVFKRVGG